MPWTLKSTPATQADQTSFIGGKPCLPATHSIPVCKLCGACQTFFFQVAFPKEEFWAGSTLAVFQCTKCADEDHLIPEMLNGGLHGADIPQGFLLQYQRNFALLVFPTEDAKPAADYEESIAFAEIRFGKGTSLGKFGKMGGPPKWRMKDESPATYAGSTEMEFLLQVKADFKFEIHPEAPAQKEVDWGFPVSNPRKNHYDLFIGNALYFFGTKTGDPAVYALTQVD